MSNLGPAFLALLIATAANVLELVALKYPRTYFLLTVSSCPPLYIYSLIYGAIAGFIVFTGIIPAQLRTNIDIWTEALLVGIGIKAVLRIRFFSVPEANTSTKLEVPVGFETFIFILDTWFLPMIDLSEFNRVRRFLEPWADKFSDLKEVRQIFEHELSQNYKSVWKEIEAKLDDPDPNSIKKISDAFEYFLKQMGKETLIRAFDLKPQKTGETTVGSV
jgi:hypothetical protein